MKNRLFLAVVVGLSVSGMSYAQNSDSPVSMHSVTMLDEQGAESSLQPNHGHWERRERRQWERRERRSWERRERRSWERQRWERRGGWGFRNN